MKKFLFIFIFMVLSLTSKAQFVEEYERYDYDTNTVYYTMKDPQTSVVLATGTFVDKKRSGLWYQYYPSGKIQFVQRYENGVRTGTWKSWDNNGRLVSRLVYKRGKLVASSISKYY
jgi:antitoxin component YwqK of YwqJK toxin-antitoxin module